MNWREATSGIYFLRNTANDRIYIGQSHRIEVRIDQHIRDLARQAHHNAALQADWNLFGASAFSYDILAEIDTQRQRYTMETFFIKIFRTFDPTLGYNIYTDHWQAKKASKHHAHVR